MQPAQAVPYQSTPVATRLWEVDTLRGIAVVMMIFFHFMWDLQYFNVADVNVFSTPWQLFARGIGTSFTFLLGLSIVLRYERDTKQSTYMEAYRPYIQRGAMIFGLGMLITVATYFAIGEGFVVFGILHLLGLSLILAYPFVYVRPLVNLANGISVFMVGLYINMVRVDFPWLIWLGLAEQGRTMVDYYPLLPWFGAALIGVAAGQLCYPYGKRAFTLPDLGDFPLLRGLRFLGRHSLIIYLVHQPIIIGILIGFGFGSL